MKKNIWENVYYRLNDETEIKLSLLFCIREASIPISDIELKHFMLDATSVDFIALCSAIAEMQAEGYIEIVWRDEIEKYSLTQKGNELLDMFCDKIMASVRASLRRCINEYFRREQEKARVRAEIIPIKKDTYALDIEVKEGKDTLIRMSLFAGSRKRAISMRRAFSEDPMELYTTVVSYLNSKKTEDSDTELTI